MRIAFDKKKQDALAPFITDEEFFRLNPHAGARVRHWRDEDEDRCRGMFGAECERFWITVAWRDGTISVRHFPFHGDEDRRWRRRWYQRFVWKLRFWLLILAVRPGTR